MEHRGVVITAGFDKSMSAIAVAELLNRRDIPVHGFIVVSPYSWSRLRSYIKKRGISFLWEALPRLLGYKTAGSDKGKNYMKEYIEGKEIFYRSIKNWASNKGVDYCSVSSINDQHVAEYLKDVSPEWLVYCGGGIIRQEVIKTIGGQILNAHQGPLPEVRGMNAAEWSILLGENQEVTIHLIDQGIDTGDIITALPYSITPDDTIKTIRDKAKIKGIEGLVEVASKSNLDDYELRSNNSNYRQCYILSDTMKELLRRKLKYIQKQKV